MILWFALLIGALSAVGVIYYVTACERAGYLNPFGNPLRNIVKIQDMWEEEATKKASAVFRAELIRTFTLAAQARKEGNARGWYSNCDENSFAEAFIAMQKAVQPQTVNVSNLTLQ